MIIKLIKSITKMIVLPVEEEQDKYMKDHILTPNREDWRDDRSWRLWISSTRIWDIGLLKPIQCGLYVEEEKSSSTEKKRMDTD